MELLAFFTLICIFVLSLLLGFIYAFLNSNFLLGLGIITFIWLIILHYWTEARKDK